MYGIDSFFILFDWRMGNLFFLKKSLLGGGINQQTTLKPLAYDVIAFQGSVVALLVVTAMFFSVDVLLSVVSGSLCAWIPHAYFSWKACRHVGASVAREALLCFYMGELGKFLLTFLMLAIVFTQIKSLLPLIFFGTYIIIQGTQWFIPLFIRNYYIRNNGEFYGG